MKPAQTQNTILKVSQSDISESEIEAVSKILKSNPSLGMGPEVKKFEDDLKLFLGASKETQVLATASGFAAIQLALHACGVGPGDEVLVPTISNVAVFQAIASIGARPVSVDVHTDSGQIKMKDCPKLVSARTRAILPVHFGGHTGDLSDVYIFAQRYKLRVIEDAAHSFGSTYENLMIGCTGDIVCFSFDSYKNITTGEGGAVVTRDKKIAAKIMDSRLLGMTKDTEKKYNNERNWHFDVNDQGWCYHMSDINAAIGREQLKRFTSMAEQRKKIATSYIETFRDSENLVYLDLKYMNIIPHIFCILVAPEKRDDLRKYLAERRIETGLHYLPNHHLNRFKCNYPLPGAEEYAKRIISLPCHSKMTMADVDRVCLEIKSFFTPYSPF